MYYNGSVNRALMSRTCYAVGWMHGMGWIL